MEASLAICDQTAPDSCSPPHSHLQNNFLALCILQAESLRTGLRHSLCAQELYPLSGFGYGWRWEMVGPEVQLSWKDVQSQAKGFLLPRAYCRILRGAGLPEHLALRPIIEAKAPWAIVLSTVASRRREYTQ